MKIIQRYKEISMHRKNFDIVTNNIHYPIASFLCTLISFSRITPNMVTFFAFLSELGAVGLILINLIKYRFLIVLLLQFGWIFDLMDGMLARYKKLGFYHPMNPSLKGYYWDSVSDHILRLLVLSVLGVFLAQQSENGIIYAVVGISIHAITQLEHIISDFILKGVDKPQSSKDHSNGIINKIILLIINIYLFYFIFILLNRIDLLFIVLPIIQFILFSKRFIQFSYSKY